MSPLILASALSILSLDSSAATSQAAAAQGVRQQAPPATQAGGNASDPTKRPHWATGGGASVPEANCYYVFGDLRCDRLPSQERPRK